MGLFASCVMIAKELEGSAHQLSCQGFDRSHGGWCLGRHLYEAHRWSPEVDLVFLAKNTHGFSEGRFASGRQNWLFGPPSMQISELPGKRGM